MEALVYKNLLLRSQALLEPDPAAQKALIAEADQLRDRAIEIRNQREAAACPPPPMHRSAAAGAASGELPRPRRLRRQHQNHCGRPSRLTPQ